MTMKLINKRTFTNGTVYLLKTHDGYLIETTDTFLPLYTRDAVGRRQNALTCSDPGTRRERWMIGVSVMSGCPVRCRFCATGQMRRCRNLTAQEIIEQISFVLSQNPELDPRNAQEFKINYTRMGEPFLNLEAVKTAVAAITARFPAAHHYISTIGVEGADYSWIKDNITLQISLHSLDEARRNELIPFKRKVEIAELGRIAVSSRLKTTVNLTLVDETDFSISALKRWFSPERFFIKLSPINPNIISERNGLGVGAIRAENVI